jgi:cytochrome c biogenesis protein CcmG, thiol:disulfide interchange protein DsbE
VTPRPVAAVAVAFVLAACTGAEPSVEAIQQGRDAAVSPPAVADDEVLPEIEVTDFAGQQLSLADLAGEPLVVNFWASWCPPCIAEMPDLEAVHALADDRVRFVGVNTQDTEERAAQLVEQTGVTYDLVRDPEGELFQAFGVLGMPSTFYVDAAGVIVGRHTGLLSREMLVDDLARHLGIDLTAAADAAGAGAR